MLCPLLSYGGRELQGRGLDPSQGNFSNSTISAIPFASILQRSPQPASSPDGKIVGMRLWHQPSSRPCWFSPPGGLPSQGEPADQAGNDCQPKVKKWKARACSCPRLSQENRKTRLTSRVPIPAILPFCGPPLAGVPKAKFSTAGRWANPPEVAGGQHRRQPRQTHQPRGDPSPKTPGQAPGGDG